VRTQALFTFENRKPIMFGNFIRGSRKSMEKTCKARGFRFLAIYQATATATWQKSFGSAYVLWLHTMGTIKCMMYNGFCGM